MSDYDEYNRLVELFIEAHDELQCTPTFHPQYALIAGKRHAAWQAVEDFKNAKCGGKPPKPEDK